VEKIITIKILLLCDNKLRSVNFRVYYNIHERITINPSTPSPKQQRTINLIFPSVYFAVVVVRFMRVRRTYTHNILIWHVKHNGNIIFFQNGHSNAQQTVYIYIQIKICVFCIPR